MRVCVHCGGHCSQVVGGGVVSSTSHVVDAAHVVDAVLAAVVVVVMRAWTPLGEW